MLKIVTKQYNLRKSDNFILFLIKGFENQHTQPPMCVCVCVCDYILLFIIIIKYSFKNMGKVEVPPIKINHRGDQGKLQTRRLLYNHKVQRL